MGLKNKTKKFRVGKNQVVTTGHLRPHARFVPRYHKIASRRGQSCTVTSFKRALLTCKNIRVRHTHSPDVIFLAALCNKQSLQGTRSARGESTRQYY
jgi:hypothetical protein